MVFLDTDAVPAKEMRSSAGNVHNPIEATLCAQLVVSLLACGLAPSQVRSAAGPPARLLAARKGAGGALATS